MPSAQDQADAEAAIAFQAVGKSFAGGALALDDITFTLPRGQFVAIVGASGSGKTTLLQLVNRLCDPSHGRVLVNGMDVLAQDPVLLRRRIGYAFQEIGLFPHMTIAENVGIALRLLERPAPEIAARVTDLMALVRLDPALCIRFPHELSGGQRQRVGIARALAAEPPIMLLDEPFAALDPLTREALGQDYAELHGNLGLTTLMVTHDMGEALLLADRIVVLGRGKVVADGPPHALSEHDDPYVRELLATPRRLAHRLFPSAGDA